MFSRLRSFTKAAFGRARFERSMSDEMRFHMDAYTDDLVRAGMSRSEAERRARIEFGGVELAKEECRQSRGLRFVDEVRQDLRYAGRQLAKTPGFTIAAVVSLALGIGASTAIFSLMDAVMFRLLAVDEPQALYYLSHGRGPDTSSSSNYPIFERYKAAGIFEGVAAFSRHLFVISTPAGPERVNGQYVSGNYHAVIRAPISLGRGFSGEPDRAVGQPPIAVISDGYWRRKYGGGAARDVIGKTLMIRGRAVEIVGVTAPGFHGLYSGSPVDVTLPISVRALDEPEYFDARDGWTSLTLVGRLADASGHAQARAAANAVFTRFWMEPENAWARDGGRADHERALLVPAGRGSSALRKQYAKPLRVLMGMVGIVLLIACVNVANLLLARAASRGKELAVRMSIGAGRLRLLRQLFTESVLLALGGGVLGLVVAATSTRIILAFFDAGPNPIVLDASVGARVLLFATAVTALTAIAFGVIPAWRGTGVDVSSVLKESPRRGRGVRLRSQQALVAGQIALCLVVLAGAALLARTLRNLRTMDTGFERHQVLLFKVETTAPGFTDDRRTAFYATLLERLRGLPGVAAAAYAKRTPVDFSAEFRGFSVPGITDPNARNGISSNAVSPDFFSAFGIGLVRGRLFTDQDRAGSDRVAIIGESVVRRYFGAADPIGRIFITGVNKDRMTIVGVVRDIHQERLRDEPTEMAYVPLAQLPVGMDGRGGVPSQLTAIVRVNGDPRGLASLIRGEATAVDRASMVSYMRTMHEQLDVALVRERLLAGLSTGFALLALILASVGLYGVVSYGVARRMREIGIRMAVGARGVVVLAQILRETLVVAIVGIAAGVAATLYGAKVLSSFLFGLSANDPGTLIAVAAVLLATALAAGYLPARRAARVDPIRVLRADG
jgi:predicted permease